MTNSWDEMRKAKENSYFERKNQEALERIKAAASQLKPRLSPVTGEPMEREVLFGVIIDRCKTSGGIWLDPGELEQIVLHIKAEESKEGEGKNWVSEFLSGLFK